MDRKPMSETGCFDFLTPPYRSEKPRERGITIVSDPGLSIAEMGSLVEVAGPSSTTSSSPTMSAISGATRGRG